MFRFPALLYLAACFHVFVAATDNSQFVSVENGKFNLNNRPFFFYGTNAFYLSMFSDDEIETAFATFAASNVKVVRTWAFNDVEQKPSSGNYFQILSNGTSIINNGVNGLQRLDKIVCTASKFGIKLLLTLTNNWNPVRPEPDTSLTRKDNSPSVLPRGYLSNDYGGIDLYVREFGSTGFHDEFYTNPTIISAFKHYISAVISRYADNTTIFGWELANDPRCSSTLPASPTCNPHTITQWVSDLSGFVLSLDSQHLITAGDGGFYCIGCPKLFPSPAGSTSSPLPGSAFDGSFGVDTEDIMNIPCIGFGSFQLFPDQVTYFPTQTSNFTINSIAEGNHWVTIHSGSASLLGKPTVFTAFELVDQATWPFFVPFNEFALSPGGPPGSGGVLENQHDYATTSWGITSLNNDSVGGALEFHWLTGGLSNCTLQGRDSSTPQYATPNFLTGALFNDK
jgi:mannan endo-1,4-beta-mannosidase